MGMLLTILVLTLIFVLLCFKPIWEAMHEFEVDATIPNMDASSAVFPTVRIVPNALVLAFHLPGCTESAVIRFNGSQNWTYGYPNDEGLPEHPLWSKGLRYYEFHKGKAKGDGLRCWIGTFHDGTFTIEACSVEVVAERIAGRPADAINACCGAGDNRILDEDE